MILIMKRLLALFFFGFFSIIGFSQKSKTIYSNQVNIEKGLEYDLDVINDYIKIIESYTAKSVTLGTLTKGSGVNFIHVNNSKISKSFRNRINDNGSVDFYIDGNDRYVNVYVANDLQVTRGIYYVLNKIGFEFLAPHTPDQDFWTYKPSKPSIVKESKLVEFHIPKVKYSGTGGIGGNIEAYNVQKETFILKHPKRLHLNLSKTEGHSFHTFYSDNSDTIDYYHKNKNIIILNDYDSIPKKDINEESIEAIQIAIDWIEEKFLKRSVPVGKKNPATGIDNSLQKTFIIGLSPSDGIGSLQGTEGSGVYGVTNTITKYMYIANQVAHHLNNKYDIFKNEWKIQYYAYGDGTGVASAPGKNVFVNPKTGAGLPLEDNFLITLIPYAFQEDYKSFEEMSNDWLDKHPNYEYAVYDYWNITPWSKGGLPEENLLKEVDKIDVWKQFGMQSAHIESTHFILTAPFFWIASKKIQSQNISNCVEEFVNYIQKTNKKVVSIEDGGIQNKGPGRAVFASSQVIKQNGYIEFPVKDIANGESIKIGFAPVGYTYADILDKQIQYYIWIHPKYNTYSIEGLSKGFPKELSKGFPKETNIGNLQIGEKIRLEKINNEIHFSRIGLKGKKTIVAKTKGDLAFNGPVEVVITMSEASTLEDLIIQTDSNCLDNVDETNTTEQLWQDYLNMAFGPAAGEMEDAYDVMFNWSGEISMPYLIRELDNARNTTRLSDEQLQRIRTYFVYVHYLSLYYDCKNNSTEDNALIMERYAKRMNELCVLQTWAVYKYNYGKNKPYDYGGSPDSDSEYVSTETYSELEDQIIADFEADLVKYPILIKPVKFKRDITNAALSSEYPPLPGLHAYTEDLIFSFYVPKGVNELSFIFQPEKEGKIFEIYNKFDTIVVEVYDTSIIKSNSDVTKTIKLKRGGQHFIKWKTLAARDILHPNDIVNFFHKSGSLHSGNRVNNWYMYIPLDATEIILFSSHAYDIDKGPGDVAISFFINGEWIDQEPPIKIDEKGNPIFNDDGPVYETIYSQHYRIEVPKEQRGKLCKIRNSTHLWDILNFERLISKSAFTYDEP